MKTIAAQLEREYPERNTGWSVNLVPVHEQTVDQIRPALQVLAGAVLLVLLVSCVNVANLLLARSTVRRRELALRMALGARRGRLVWQMLVESMSLAAMGGVAGLALAFLFHRGLRALVADRLPVPRLDQVSLDLTVVALTMGLSLATGLVFGLVPALVSSHALSGAVRGGRQDDGPRARRVLGTLVAAEVALSLVLLAGAGLLVRSFVRLSNINPGFRAEGLLTARVQLPATRYGSPSAHQASMPTSWHGSQRSRASKARRESRSCPSPGRRHRHELLANRSTDSRTGTTAVYRRPSCHAGILSHHGDSAGDGS